MKGDPDAQLVTKAVQDLVAEHPPGSTSAVDFLGARYDAGLAWVHFDRGCGGLALPARLQPRVTETLRRAGAPDASENYVGVHQAAAMIHTFAPEDLRHRWLRPAFTNEEFWCQLFSEPGAGSDLAGLSTSAVRDGDHWIVTGEKVWTSFAHRARWGILLARTEPSLPKHRGLSLFVIDMQSDGMDIRPLRTMDGGRTFNEVHLTHVGVPDRYRLGEAGQGWAVSQRLLASERAAMLEQEALVQWLLGVCRQHGGMSEVMTARRDHVVCAAVTDRLATVLAERVQQIRGTPEEGMLAPLVKLGRNLADQGTANAVMETLGPEATLGGDYAWQTEGRDRNDQLRFLESRSTTIGGGTAEIMRNIIGERLLGLPMEPRVDKERPWNIVPRA